LRALAEEVSLRLKKHDLSGRTVTLKLKTQDFKSRTRALSLPDPTQLADRIFRAGLLLLDREIDGTLFRLIGIGVSDLEDDVRADPTDLVDEAATKRAKAELAMDALREKFGKDAVETGYTFGRGKRGRIE
jgi:DNA polymerase-4